ncbi:MAG: hypothetical protein KDA72_11295 [Planctomycetales bacterium]|nr:hypothetical protein [Planctomycetales bacterium]
MKTAIDGWCQHAVRQISFELGEIEAEKIASAKRFGETIASDFYRWRGVETMLSTAVLLLPKTESSI